MSARFSPQVPTSPTPPPTNTGHLAMMYMTTGQVALYLTVNRITVQRWLKSGQLSGERVGNVTLIPRAEVEALRLHREGTYR